MDIFFHDGPWVAALFCPQALGSRETCVWSKMRGMLRHVPPPSMPSLDPFTYLDVSSPLLFPGRYYSGTSSHHRRAALVPSHSLTVMCFVGACNPPSRVSRAGSPKDGPSHPANWAFPMTPPSPSMAAYAPGLGGKKVSFGKCLS